MLQVDFQFLEHINNIKLSVLITADSFFYAISDSNNKLLCHCSYDGIRFSDPALTDKILLDKNLRLSFDRINVLLLTPELLHLPEREMEKAVMTFPALQHKLVKVEKIPGNQAFTYFGTNPHQEALLNQLFGNNGYTLRSVASVFSNYYLGYQEDIVHLHIETSMISLYVSKDGNMVFCNNFKIHGIHDILYFLLAVGKTTDIDPAQGVINISGWVEKDSALFKLLSGYFKNLIISDLDQFSISEKADGQLKSHYYFLHHINLL